MDAILSEQWLWGLDSIPMLDDASVALARLQVREQAGRLGLPDVVTGSLVNIASELGHNQLAHARRGSIAVRPIARAGVHGLEIVAADLGTGIADPRAALAGRSRMSAVDGEARPKSLGIGLAAVLELADELDFDIRLGEGACIWARKFAAPVDRQREVGIFGRPYPGEDVSGDQATFVRHEDSLLLALVDGLGHGPFARSAADIAVSVLGERPEASLEGILEDCHGALHKSRGCVMSTARIHEPSSQLETVSIGNVALHVYGPGQARRFSGASFVLGAAGPRRKALREHVDLGSRDVVILFSDGLSSRIDLSAELDLLREHPIIIAQQLVEHYARDNDDALVLVAR